MKIGFIGLGRMGHAMVLRLIERGVDVVAYNRTQQRTDELSSEIKNLKFKIKNEGKLYNAYDIASLIAQLAPPRIIWLMVPHGHPVDEMIYALMSAGISKNDIVIDGGNSFYKDTVRRYKELQERGIHYIDAGTSGGLEGARNGACIMVGGDEKVVKKLSPLLNAAAMKDGWAYFGPSGAGHFVKMVHNGVEYGMLQAIGEGFEMLAKSPYNLDLHKVAFNWAHGSVVRGWLMELAVRALSNDPRLEKIEGVVGGGETGEWTVATARELLTATPVMDASLQARKDSQKKPTFAGKIVAALRNQFGGHPIERSSRSDRDVASTGQVRL